MKELSKYTFYIIGGIILILFLLRGNTTHEQFDSERWKNWTESEIKMSLRWDMMNSLRKNHELKGLTKRQVIELLGKPDEYESNLVFRYFLGMAKHGIDTGSLVIKFNKNHIVTDFYVWRG